MRNLDVTTLRSFVAAADLGGVTRAAGMLNLTQSAVSMQLKRLEELVGIALFDRSGRSIALTSAGEQFLSYARRMVDLNDEVFSRLTDQKYEGEVILGVPHDIVYPVIPQVLQRFNVEYPRMRVHLLSSHTSLLKAQFERGECDIILTTEYGVDADGETLGVVPLRWVMAPEGNCFRQRPLRLAFGRHCKFRPIAQSILDRADIPWEMAVETESDRTIEATVSADLAVTAMLEGHEPAHMARVPQGAGLPDLGVQQINLYRASVKANLVINRLTELMRQGYRTLNPGIRQVG